MFLLPNTDCISFLLIHFASLLSASFHLSTSLATLHDFPITKLCFCDSLPRATTQRSPALTHSSTFNTRQLHKLTHAYYTYTYLVPYTARAHYHVHTASCRLCAFMDSASMVNTTSPSDRESSHAQESTSSRPVSPTTTPASEAAPKRLTLKEYTARKQQQAAASEVAPKVKRLTLEEYTARKKRQATTPQASTRKSAHIAIPRIDTDDNVVQRYVDEPVAQATHIPWATATIDETSRRSLLFRRKDDKLESANRNATWTSTPRSKVEDDVLLSAIATANPFMPSDHVLENYTAVATPSETSDHTFELDDDVTVPAATITTPAVISDSPCSLFPLPRELRDYVYGYLAPDEAFWIARPPVVGEQENAIVERASMHKSAALIKSKHSLIFVSRDTRDEFRVALWRAYVDDPDRQATLRVYDFDPKPIRDLFTGCSPLDLSKLLAKEIDHVNMYFTGDLQRYRDLGQLNLRGLIQTLMMRWVSFCDEKGLNPMYSFSSSRCAWTDMAVVDIAISQETDESPKGWYEIRSNPHFQRLEAFFQVRFGRHLLGDSLDHVQQDELIEKKWMV